MPMNKDYSYDYDWDERYCYPHSNVLKNKLGITDAKQLLVAEREITSLRIARAKLKPIRGSFDLNICKRFTATFSGISMSGLEKSAGSILRRETYSVPRNILKRRRTNCSAIFIKKALLVERLRHCRFDWHTISARSM